MSARPVSPASRPEPAQLRARQQEAAAAAGLDAFFRDALASGGSGPELAVIPAGDFVMGAGEGARRFGELPARTVAIDAPFAIGRYTVTADEFADYARAAGFVWADHLVRTEGRQPVTNISSGQAADYLAWLCAETGQRYRFPSEAEWEYAAGAGSRTDYCFGDRLGCGEANIGALLAGTQGTTGWRRWIPFCVPLNQACAVGSYPANVWGLFEVHGNVWEFTSDTWQGPLDASQRLPRDSLGRWLVTKGGSWFEGTADARLAARKPRLENELDMNLGLRVVREL